jgi:phenylacetic acid degradation operon negative regulatory protein
MTEPLRTSDTTIEDLSARPGARSLLLTLLGEFVYPRGGSVWTSTVVRSLETVGVTERNARQAIARLADQGIASPERLGRRTRWHLTDHGMRLLGSGSERIYSFGHRADTWDETWLLVICAIPETKRAVRHQFRTQLTFEGFGFLSPGIAISPHADREKAANDILADLGLADTAMTFRSTSGSMTSDGVVLATAWDLDDLAAHYADFIDRFSAESAGDSADALPTTLLLVDAWRRFPFADPELPTTLLPQRWIGGLAQEVFDRVHSVLKAPAAEWYDHVEAQADAG